MIKVLNETVRRPIVEIESTYSNYCCIVDDMFTI